MDSDPVTGTTWSSSAKGLQPSLCIEGVPGPAEPVERPATPTPWAQASCADPTHPGGDGEGKRNQDRHCQRLPEQGCRCHQLPGKAAAGRTGLAEGKIHLCSPLPPLMALRGSCRGPFHCPGYRRVGVHDSDQCPAGAGLLDKPVSSPVVCLFPLSVIPWPLALQGWGVRHAPSHPWGEHWHRGAQPPPGASLGAGGPSEDSPAQGLGPS